MITYNLVKHAYFVAPLSNSTTGIFVVRATARSHTGPLSLQEPMALTTEDVARIARLARLELSEEQSTLMQTELNQVLDLIETLQSVDTQGVEPLTHPLSALQDIELRLRTDEALPTNPLETRRKLMANAPAQEEGLFLVPRVIE